MIKDPVVITFTILMVLAIGWLLIDLLNKTNRGFRKGFRSMKCKFGIHAPSGRFAPAIGGRDVMRCLYCDEIVYEVKRTKNSLRRSQ